MNRVRVSKDFFLDEFIHPELYARFGTKSLLWIRPEIIVIAQEIRNLFGKTIINNWSANGAFTPDEFLKLNRKMQDGYFTESGLRLPLTSIGAKYSMHKYGCAVDLKFTDVTPQEVRDYLIKYYKLKFQPLGLTRMEDETPSWVHVDIANTASQNLIVFKP
jgi:hypothetical protein